MTRAANVSPGLYRPKFKNRHCVIQESRVWWGRSGRHRKSMHTTSLREATKRYHAWVTSLANGMIITPETERTTLIDGQQIILDHYVLKGRRSVRRTKISIAHLIQFFGADCRLMHITTDRAGAYVVARTEAGAAPATIQNELAALKRILALAHRAGKLTVRPYIEMPAVQNTRTGFFEDTEFRAIQAQLSNALKTVVEFMYYTGWRTSEVLSLLWRQIDFQAGVVRLDPGTTKNREGRTFPFALLPALASLLRAQREHTTVIERRTGRIIQYVFHREGQLIKAFLGGWHAACERAGLPGRIPHDFRRTAVRNLERAGVPRSQAMSLTGHKTEAVYRRYAIVSASDQRDAVGKLARLHEQQSPAAQTVIPLGSSKDIAKTRARRSTAWREANG